MSKPDLRAAQLLSCPVPLPANEYIQLAHGGGGELTHRLIQAVFAAGFQSATLDTARDAAVIDAGGMHMAFTTDSYVVNPLFFPGGDIGALAVNGTVNDLAMVGARPLVMSAGFILEEGLPMDTLARVVASMRAAAAEATIDIVTGDTKVVERGKGDGLFINTSGIGAVLPGRALGPGRVQPGDAVIVSGDVGRHGLAILSVREGLGFESAIESDCAPLIDPVMALFAAGIDVHCMRDLTRGGLAAAVNEIARSAELGIEITERAVPVSPSVRSACEILGLDPMHAANEGRFVAFVPDAQARNALDALRGQPGSEEAARIGVVESVQPGGLVNMITALGTRRVMDMPSGAELPRIC